MVNMSLKDLCSNACSNTDNQAQHEWHAACPGMLLAVVKDGKESELILDGPNSDLQQNRF